MTFEPELIKVYKIRGFQIDNKMVLLFFGFVGRLDDSLKKSVMQEIFKIK